MFCIETFERDFSGTVDFPIVGNYIETYSRVWQIFVNVQGMETENDNKIEATSSFFSDKLLNFFNSNQRGSNDKRWLVWTQ